MNNKGTQALLKSDVSLIKELFGDDVIFSVSTTDVEGVRGFGCFEKVFPPLIDIPYEKADFYARRMAFSRSSLRYKLIAVAYLLWMLIELALAMLSTVFVRVGLKPPYRGDLLMEIKSSSVIVSYSNENFKEGVSYLPLNAYWMLSWWCMLISRTWIVFAAKFLGKKLVMFPNSIGGFRTWVGRFLAKLALNRFDYILVREPRSLRNLTSLGVQTPVTMVSDTALLLGADNSRSNTGLKRPLLCVSVGVYSHTLSSKEINWFVNVYSRVLDAAIQKYGFNVIFLPHYVSGFRYDDLEVSQLIHNSMRFKDKAQIAEPSSLQDYTFLLSSADLVISSKMHPAVLAVASYVPTLCIVYDSKQVGFFEQLGLPECILPVTNLSLDTFLSKIDHIWNRRQSIREVLGQRIPKLQRKIRSVVRKVLMEVTHQDASITISS